MKPVNRPMSIRQASSPRPRKVFAVPGDSGKRWIQRMKTTCTCCAPLKARIP